MNGYMGGSGLIGMRVRVDGWIYGWMGGGSEWMDGWVVVVNGWMGGWW